ncbi:MAG: ABC transporter permease subunit [Micromonosporaceae bacterium]|nr:ABC transporter permease subunit [Micromonosporaceae bacterium]
MTAVQPSATRAGEPGSPVADPPSRTAGRPRRGAPPVTAPRNVRWAGYVLCAVVTLFVLTPLAVIIGSSLTPQRYWQFPPEGLTFQWYEQLLTDAEFMRSLLVSFVVAVIVTLIGTAVGLLGAIAIVRGPRGTSQRLALGTLLPVLFPNVAIGVAIFMLYANLGVPIGIVTLALAQLILVLPFTIRLLMVGLTGINPNLERAAQNLGAPPGMAVVKVVLPLIKGATLTAALITFVHSLDDAAVALFINNPDTITVPVRLLLYQETQPGPLIAAGGTILMVVGVVVCAVIVKTVGLGRAFGVSSGKG